MFQIRRDKPLYLRSVGSNQPQKVIPSSGRFNPISDNDLELLMESDIIKTVKNIGYLLNDICLALRQKLAQTGMPFFNIQCCLEAVMRQEEAKNLQDGSEANAPLEPNAIDVKQIVEMQPYTEPTNKKVNIANKFSLEKNNENTFSPSLKIKG